MNENGKGPVRLSSMATISLGDASFGTIKDLRFEGVKEPTEFIGTKSKNISMTFDAQLVAGPALGKLIRKLRDNEIKLQKLRHRALRPQRKAYRRSLSRKRIAATRRWHVLYGRAQRGELSYREAVELASLPHPYR